MNGYIIIQASVCSTIISRLRKFEHAPELDHYTHAQSSSLRLTRRRAPLSAGTLPPRVLSRSRSFVGRVVCCFELFSRSAGEHTLVLVPLFTLALTN